MQSQTLYRFTDSALRSSPSATTSTSSSTGSTAHPGNCPIAPASPPSADSSRATPGSASSQARRRSSVGTPRSSAAGERPSASAFVDDLPPDPSAASYPPAGSRRTHGGATAASRESSLIKFGRPCSTSPSTACSAAATSLSLIVLAKALGTGSSASTPTTLSARGLPSLQLSLMVPAFGRGGCDPLHRSGRSSVSPWRRSRLWPASEVCARPTARARRNPRHGDRPAGQ